MIKSELDDPAPSLPAAVPVICDRCRAAGIAGDAAFAAIPDILAFDPVPRRAHVNNWTAEHQRAFITALAITGSPRQAGRALGRHPFGAEQLRSARGGRSFAAAWDAALELARDREFARIHANLSDLSAQRDAELAAAPFATVAASRHGGPLAIDEEDGERGEYLASIRSIAHKLTMCRRLLLASIAPDPAKRAAWEVLVGAVDWDKAGRLERQHDERFASDPDRPEAGLSNMRAPDMVLTAEAGLLDELTGRPGPLTELCEEAQKARAEEAGLPADEQAALAGHRARLVDEGWIEDEDGNFWSPEPPSVAE